MKVRILFWLMMSALIAGTGIMVWLHNRPAPASVVTTAQNSPASPVPHPVVKTFPPKVQPVPRPTVNAAVTTNEPSLVARTIVDGQADYQKRHEAIQSLATGKLDEAGRELLYDFLRQHNADDDQQSGQVLKNQLLDALCQRQPPSQGLGELLQQIYQDNGQNIVLRDYAVQHLTAYYRQMATASGVDDQTRSDELKLTQQTLSQALAHADSSIAGTALLGMSHLAQEGWNGFDPAKVGQSALNLAADNNTGELTKITAIQVCASLGITDALPEIVDTAKQAQSEPLKISAIGALGLLGGSDQIAFLNGVLSGDDDRLKMPAKTAIDRINGRLQQAAQANHTRS